jgi:hypothetical protein
MGVVGCSGSDESTTYGTQTVESSLESHGFEVGVIFDRTSGRQPNGAALALLSLFDGVEDVDALVADSAPDGAIGREVSAWVFDNGDHADEFQAGSTLRLQNGNVVVLTDVEHRDAAKAALDELG